jgi:predicted deacetylase
VSPIERHLALDEPMLCVSIHDVAPGTWEECARLARSMREVAQVRLTWLVVPRYHERIEDEGAMRRGLDAALAHGDELALHGYTHLDTGRASKGLRQRFLRGVYTQREGEFAALAAEEARERIALGLEWFRQRDWPVAGFVPPAWLLGAAAWRVLPEFAFSYTTTFTRFHLLRQGRSVFAPSLVYTARNAAGRALSPLAASAAARCMGRAPLVRLSLHPPDVRHPHLVAHAQRLVERMLATREAVTKAECARRLLARSQATVRPG